MKKSVHSMISNICFQSEVIEDGKPYTLDFKENEEKTFEIKIPKNKNVKISLSNSKIDGAVIYGAINIPLPDGLRYDYYHSGNSEVKEIVLKWKENKNQFNMNERILEDFTSFENDQFSKETSEISSKRVNVLDLEKATFGDDNDNQMISSNSKQHMGT